MKGKRLASLLLALLLVLACCPVLSAQAADNGDYTREDIAWYMDGIVSWCAKRLGVSEDAIPAPGRRNMPPMAGWIGMRFICTARAMRATMPPTAARSRTPSAGNIRKVAVWTVSAPRSGTAPALRPRPAAATRWPSAQTLPGETINLVADGVYDRGKTEDLGAQGINGLTWGLLLLDSRGYSVPAGAADTRETILTRILSAQSAERGFAERRGRQRRSHGHDAAGARAVSEQHPRFHRNG